ncbi:hypothetical protein SZN_23586 [Streptomyces zinciresistens K42]|uniref:Uncharacterized protein n=1 Tax=Streptomyces zinciresistens K42 TaxID=700597 RepID=G2GGT3_9ACTN|nr:hypothetical protein [Streptomyces zinciresistens]EGX57279.1 hypothetical protein SZN_23586 [Streptomyces zinciresistens K42]
MPIIAGASPPGHDSPAALARGFLTGGVVGASPAALVVGAVTGKPPLFVAGLVLPALCGLLFFLAGRPRRIREAAAVPRTALAVVESLQAVRGEASDIPVRFELSVAPDDGPSYRVEITQDFNLVDLPDYRPRGVVVVQYPPDRPWRVRIVKRPTPQWEERAAAARLDSAPATVTVTAPPEGGAFCLVAPLGLLLGAAAVVLPFRADLVGQDVTAKPPSAARPSVTSTSSASSTSTTVVSSVSGTVALGPGRSFLDKGELGRALGSLTRGGDTRRALTVVVRERLLSIVFSPSGTRTPGFDPRTLPRSRFSALVEDATATLGVRSPRTWQITADRLTGSLVIRVAVSGAEGTASLEADGQGRVVRRAPAR